MHGRWSRLVWRLVWGASLGHPSFSISISEQIFEVKVSRCLLRCPPVHPMFAWRAFKVSEMMGVPNFFFPKLFPNFHTGIKGFGSTLVEGDDDIWKLVVVDCSPKTNVFKSDIDLWT